MKQMLACAPMRSDSGLGFSMAPLPGEIRWSPQMGRFRYSSVQSDLYGQNLKQSPFLEVDNAKLANANRQSAVF